MGDYQRVPLELEEGRSSISSFQSNPYQPSSHPHRRSFSLFRSSPFARRFPKLTVLLLLSSICIVFWAGYRLFFFTKEIASDEQIRVVRKEFEKLSQLEEALPQHNLDLPFPEGRKGRYVYFPNEAWGTGWNNVFQEQLLNTHLAYLSNRGYVFVDYIARDHPPFPDEILGVREMLHIPMSALTSGPTGGGSLQQQEPQAPRSISKAWWDKICPEQDIVRLEMGSTKIELGLDDHSDGDARMSKWASKLRSMSERCVAVVGGSPFDYMFVGGPGVLTIWPSYHTSPTLKAFAWSQIVRNAIHDNFSLLSSSAPPDPTTSTPQEPEIAGLVALHIRRGDYKDHCRNLADWGSDFNAWSLFGSPSIQEKLGAGGDDSPYPRLPDYLSIPEGMSRHDAAVMHCWPSIREIAERLDVIRKDAESNAAAGEHHLERVFISTNGDPEWVAALKEVLKEDGWTHVATSLDLKLELPQVAVSHAIDMAIAHRAQVFVGNGFSSLSSNVVQLRLTSGHQANSNRFW